jgi:hypothetical protein
VRAKAMRSRTPANWRVADTQSRLGFALLAVAVTDATLSSQALLAKVEEAQPLLLQGQEMLEKSGGAPSK